MAEKKCQVVADYVLGDLSRRGRYGDYYGKNGWDRDTGFWQDN